MCPPSLTYIFIYNTGTTEFWKMEPLPKNHAPDHTTGMARDQKQEMGNNIRISEVQALLSFSVVKEWQSIIDNKIKIASQYIEKCLELNIDHINQNLNGQKGNYRTCTDRPT